MLVNFLNFTRPLEQSVTPREKLVLANASGWHPIGNDASALQLLHFESHPVRCVTAVEPAWQLLY